MTDMLQRKQQQRQPQQRQQLQQQPRQRQSLHTDMRMTSVSIFFEKESVANHFIVFSDK